MPPGVGAGRARCPRYARFAPHCPFRLSNPSRKVSREQSPMSHADPKSYDELVAAFRWDLPRRYNIGADVCDRWARSEPSRLAIIEVMADGAKREVSFGELLA